MLTKKINIKNKKGLKLATIIDRPKDNNHCSAVIILHGFMDCKDEEHLKYLAQELVKAGYVAVRFDCSGFSDSEGTIEKDFRFSNYQTDLERVYDHVRKLKYVRKESIGVCGHSMGAMQSIIFAANHPEIKAACHISPSDSVDVPSIDFSKWKKAGYLEFTGSKVGAIRIPYAFFTDAKDLDILKYVRKTNTANTSVLVVLGNKDEVVLPEQTRAVAKAFSGEFPLLEIENMHHMYKNSRKETIGVTRKIVDFFKMHLI